MYQFHTLFLPDILLQLKTALAKPNIFQIYAPTANKTDHGVEYFHEEINDTPKQNKPKNATFIRGNWNARVVKVR